MTAFLRRAAPVSMGAALCLTLASCGGGGGVFSLPASPGVSVRPWTWMGGSARIGAAGSYGTQGTPSTKNVPGARYGGVSWGDSAGNFWLFGGLGIDSAGHQYFLNDLWQYSPSAKAWTWVSGSNLANAPAVYGTKGTASTSNSPGERGGVSSWVDAQGNFWLFGGFGSVSSVEFNDLWEYSPGANTW